MVLSHSEQHDVSKKSIDEIMNAVNVLGSHDGVVEGIIESLQTSHRTLQENFWRVMIDVIKQYSEFRFDARNEGAVNLCKFITEELNAHPEKGYLPHV